MIPVDAHTLFEVAPRFGASYADKQAMIITSVGEVLASTLDSYGINTRLRIAHFIGQTCHETAGFRTTEEFASGEAYEGRRDLGNTQVGDGRRYKGRGLLQLTGRANYRTVGNTIGVDLENHPEKAADAVPSLKIACEYWKSRNINAYCDTDDLITVTKLINGGTNGIDERRLFTTKAKTAIARIEGIAISGRTNDSQITPFPQVLHRGSKGESVADLQRMLQKKGYQVAVDGDFGAGTEVAVMDFQRRKGMTVDGIVGPITWQELA